MYIYIYTFIYKYLFKNIYLHTYIYIYILIKSLQRLCVCVSVTKCHARDMHPYLRTG